MLRAFFSPKDAQDEQYKSSRDKIPILTSNFEMNKCVNSCKTKGLSCSHENKWSKALYVAVTRSAVQEIGGRFSVDRRSGG